MPHPVSRKTPRAKPRASRAQPAAKASGRAVRPSPLVLTVGHSTRTIDEFIQLLQAHAVTRVVDVRTVPRSRHNPQFNREQLPVSLRVVGISYVHMPALGGLRRTTAVSVNTGWRNTSFRGYADYMQTPEFRAAIEALIAMAACDRLALMCAEAVPWRCHRSLIADALLVRGIRSEDISSVSRRAVHRLTPFARVRGTRITYPPLSSSSDQPTKTSTRSPSTRHGRAKPRTS